MKCRIDFFKPSGKFYIDEVAELPNGCAPWEFITSLEIHLKGRLRGMTAVASDISPWGYPHLVKIPE